MYDNELAGALSIEGLGNDIESLPELAGAHPGTGAKLVREALTKTRRYALPLSTAFGTTTGSTLTGQVQNQPQLLFRMERVVIDPGCAPSFDLTDIVIGKDSGFVATGSLPASTFTQDAVSVMLGLQTSQGGTSVAILFTNVSLAAARFRATGIGIALQ